MLTKDDVIDRLSMEVCAAGSAKEWAEAHGVSASYVSDVLATNPPSFGEVESS